MVLVQLSEFAERNQQSRFIDLADKYICKDSDVETFLKTKALDSELRHRSRTYLTLDDNATHILAYFTLALKTLTLGDNVSSNVRKRLDGFSKDTSSIASVLIGQFGKDAIAATGIPGNVFMNQCLGISLEIRKAIGGRFVWLECYPIKQVVDFYIRNGFRYLQTDLNDMYQQMFFLL